jgi:hypothetical protein
MDGEQAIIDYKKNRLFDIVENHARLTGILALVEIYVFVTNKSATSCDYLTFTTTIGYIYNYCLHLKPLATTLWLTYD